MSALSGIGGGLPSTVGTSSGAVGATGGGTFAVNGLISGLNTDQIIQGLLANDQAQITALQNREQGLVAEQTAFKTLAAKLLALQTDLSSLARRRTTRSTRCR